MINLKREMAKVKSRRDHFLAKLPGIMSTHDSVLQAWDRAILDMQSLDSVYPAPSSEQRLSIIRSLVEFMNQLHHLVPDTIEWRETFINRFFGETSPTTTPWVNSLKVLRTVLDGVPNHNVGVLTGLKYDPATKLFTHKVNDFTDTTFEWTPFVLIATNPVYPESQRRLLTAGANTDSGLKLFIREVITEEINEYASGLKVRAINPQRSYYPSNGTRPDNVRYESPGPYPIANQIVGWNASGQIPARNSVNSLLIGGEGDPNLSAQKVNYLLMGLLDDIVSGKINPDLITYGTINSNPALVTTPVDYILKDWYHITDFMRETVNAYSDLQFLYVTDDELAYMSAITDNLL